MIVVILAAQPTDLDELEGILIASGWSAQRLVGSLATTSLAEVVRLSRPATTHAPETAGHTAWLICVDEGSFASSLQRRRGYARARASCSS
jgi:hypothetical protein